ncbi:MAG: nucleotidyltransferase domain-containing protein [candidate division KSB1 bacterium]|nr:nucleotidyltransferase domain-containing protein [candidate division KSB1 bacterium]MDZ7302931.1 nucleotidyltransferase domain-containing protein [candidate division KSB1 bacterium]MDZ7312207.1 nucleotidyltransferase domain-containing protein [candidate division KSB1 bacterium]
MDYEPYIRKLRERRAQEKLLAEKKRHEALELAKEIAKVLKMSFSARQVILFGSVLSPEAFHLRSDIDMAVVGIPLDKFFTAYGHVLSMARNFNVDLVDLGNCRPAVSEKIEKEGIKL